MPRRREVPKRIILQDPKFGSQEVSKFVNVLMTSGKKSVAERLIYGAFDQIKTKSGKKGRITIQYNSFMAFDMLSKKLDMVSNPEQYVKYQYEMAQLQGKTTQWSNTGDGKLICRSISHGVS